jgi:hypothetical protein
MVPDTFFSFRNASDSPALPEVVFIQETYARDFLCLLRVGGNNSR